MRHIKVVMIICTAAVLLCASCSSVNRGEKSEPTAEPVTAILGAFEKEITLLEDQLTEQQEQRIEGMRFVSGRFNGRRTVIAWTGIGKINAAMTTTLMLEHFRPSEVLFTGIAGAVNPELGPGDIVIGLKTAHHDSGVLRPEGLTYEGARNPFDGWHNPVFLPADERLLKFAERAAQQAKFEAIDTVSGKRTPKIIKGVIVTGDIFVASTEKCAELREDLGADAVEMEGAAAAQICYQQKVPCLVIRSISDSADEGAISDKQTFHIMAAKNSASLVAEVVRLLALEACAEKDGKGG